ncbi:hypothetical protein MGYG_03431 [Nannizzia gypsea CBS 118893]|uniref:Zn(2)-C6 fungal-type domain-containing protein n=1 Tax=Arthroderma gypseum (strain ATCC MYA-4604 / CBS 118893) TaxID=535722 RepID=E4URV6_ARTGP|nr:hypothetical protein MGYG_03431 [Nannizzia gypsea CBS 118893]EFR00427.1 hypothetical protein MGYG_03431 [Nannizzia gypsea CBS 118893]
MFGTIRYDKDTNSREHVELQRASGLEARGYTPIACDRCRSRKLKCSGEKDGCEKCQTASVTCTYRDISSIKDSRRLSKRVRPCNNQLPTPSSCQASYRSQRQPLDTEMDQEPAQSTSDSEPLNWPNSSSEEFTELPNTWESSILPFQPTFPTMMDDHATLGLDISNGMHGVLESNQSSTDPENIFDAVLDTQAAYHHTTAPSQPARPNDNTQERRTGWSSLLGGNLPTTHSANKSASPPSRCDCLRDVARFLEVIGVESIETRADMLLKCVDRGMQVCREALSCSGCSVRGDNGMFLAVVLQQLVTLTRTASDKLLAWNHENRNCQGSSSGAHIPIVCIDQYRIEVPDFKVSLILHVALLHFFGLQGLANRIKDKLRPNSFAGRLITDCERIIVNTIEMIRDKASHSMPMSSAF